MSINNNMSIEDYMAIRDTFPELPALNASFNENVLEALRPVINVYQHKKGHAIYAKIKFPDIQDRVLRLMKEEGKEITVRDGGRKTCIDKLRALGVTAPEEQTEMFENLLRDVITNVRVYIKTTNR